MRESSAILRGITFSLLLWGLYLIPGSGFNIAIRELSDQFIMASVNVHHIEYTVLVIASRYILPAIVLYYGLARTSTLSVIFSVAATSLAPIILATGIVILFTMLQQNGTPAWEQFNKLILLSAYFLVVLIAGCATFILTRKKVETLQE